MPRLTTLAMSPVGALGLCLALTSGATADVVHNDDVVVVGSLCTGIDCESDIEFNFTTLLLKENNLRIDFVDTSTLSNFGRRDWRLEVNSSVNGGGEYFAIKDLGNTSNGPANGGTPILYLAARAPANSIFVDPDGDVGLGTSTPATDLHVVSANTPTIRLDQDGSGPAPYVWEMSGNQSSLSIRDVTAGRVPVNIGKKAPTNSLVLKSNSGDVGMGTANPKAALHVVKGGSASARTMLRLSNKGDAGFIMENTDSNHRWETTAGNLWKIAHNGSLAFRLTKTGDVTIPGTLTTGGGTCGGGCDRVFDRDYDVPTIEEHAVAMWGAGYLPNVGPTPEGRPIDLPEKLGRMLNELEKAHIYIDQLNQRLAEQRQTISEQQQRIDGLETERTELSALRKRLEEIEKTLTAGKSG